VHTYLFSAFDSVAPGSFMCAMVALVLLFWTVWVSCALFVALKSDGDRADRARDLVRIFTDLLRRSGGDQR